MKIYESANYDRIAKINRSVHEIHAQQYPDHFKIYDYEGVKQFFKTVIGKPQHKFLLMGEEDQEIGYAWIEIRSHAENVFKKGYQSVYIHQLNIDEGYRGKGYGKRLMEYIENLGIQYGAKFIEVDYWIKNTIAGEFYRKTGFKAYREFLYKEV